MGIRITCDDCGDKISHDSLTDVNEDSNGQVLCDTCATTSWKDLDFPVWAEYYYHDDDWDLAREFCYQYDLDIECLPSRDMKCVDISVWYKVHEDGSVEGPYDKKNGDLI